MIPTVEHNWVLCKTSNLSPIKQLTGAHDKKITFMLNQGGTATTWLHLLDPDCKLIQEHTTSLVCYRNGRAIWSGEIFDINEESSASTDQLQITALGWFKLFEKRDVHVGEEWEKMLAKSGVSYIPVATESALELYYTEKSFSTIAADLINRANIDVPTGIAVGLQPPMLNLNFKIPKLHPVGELLSQLTSIESGFDFNIDPLERKFNMYYNQIKGNINGLGQDRGAGVRFTYPGNCTMAKRSATGTKTQNRTYATGEYGVGLGEEPTSVAENGLFEASENLPDVKNTQILIAYAEIQSQTLAKPWTVITFNPKSVSELDTVTPTVPRPFEDYELGDIVYCTIEKGNRFKIGTEKYPQPVRIFGFQLEITDGGQEKISNIQTTYV